MPMMMSSKWSRYWPFVRGIHQSPVNSPHKGQWRGTLMFSLICYWTNGWVDNREADDFRRHQAHRDVAAMATFNSGLDFKTILCVNQRQTYEPMKCAYHSGRCSLWFIYLCIISGQVRDWIKRVRKLAMNRIPSQFIPGNVFLTNKNI